MSRTIRKPKTGGKAVSRHCQNGGSCNWCRDNRTIASQRAEPLDQQYEIDCPLMMSGNCAYLVNKQYCNPETCGSCPYSMYPPELYEI